MLRARVDKLMEGGRDVVEDAIGGGYYETRWITGRNGKKPHECKGYRLKNNLCLFVWMESDLRGYLVFNSASIS